jgi:hypothetical protein
MPINGFKMVRENDMSNPSQISNVAKRQSAGKFAHLKNPAVRRVQYLYAEEGELA